jgi:hypothetical protein
MSRRDALPLYPLQSSLPSERPPYVAVSRLRHSVVGPVESLLTCETCPPIRLSLQSACQEVPRQPDAFGGFCGSNSDSCTPPALRRSWPPQQPRHKYKASSLRQPDSVPVSPIKPALPLNTLSDRGRVPIQSTLSAAQYAPRFSPLVESLRKNGGARGVDLSPSLHGVADGSSGNLQLPTSPGWAD